MPRGGGGGSRGGGGFRGGGGGFRGGGFRGGSASFRMGGGRPSGMPFGRTGASRIVSRSPSGPYRHTYYRPYRSYYRGFYRPYWWYGRPWYWRWWYSPWWSGYYYRPWYYSPAYVGGGIIFAIILGLILLPLFGVAIWFPFSRADPSGNVTYRSTEVLYFNEYWYERENIKAENVITFNVQSSSSPIGFAIWDQPFENLPTTTVYGGSTEQFSLMQNYYEYFSVYLRPGSSIDYDFNSTLSIDFFIADAYQLYQWNQGGSPSFYLDMKTNESSGTFDTTPYQAQDYYLVWYNENVTMAIVDVIYSFTAVSVIDLSGADYSEVDTYAAVGSFEVPRSGDWYFFIYFDPLYSIEETTSISFDVSYDTGLTSSDRWISVSPILIVILAIIGIIIIAAIVARRGQKRNKLQPSEKAKLIEPKVEIPEAKAETKPSKCIRCGSDVRADANFCPSCGGKIEGRKIGESSVITPAKSKICSYCGSKLTESDNFCKWCGTQVEKS